MSIYCKLLLFMTFIFCQNNEINLNNNEYYNLPARIDLTLGAGQFEYIDLNPSSSLFSYGFFHDIYGSVLFDQLEKEFIDKILVKIHKSIPEKYLKKHKI